MGNHIKAGKVENSNIIGGNVSGNVTTGAGATTSSGKNKSNAPEEGNLIKNIEKASSKAGLFLITIFLLALIVLFVLTR
ncbi:hypothetical protein [Candidatus Thiosymbion oneisti]|uniref:hypothetical protein n=1 Tax=Candidatus Thiosymbion oneisti TaxID=589554 RepID=UPI00114CF877|nr:hypothetical protein [Candidatus Thiosymbion oneisti]